MKKSEQSTDKVTKESNNVLRSELERLSAIFPQFVKDGTVNFDAFREFFGEEGVLAEAGQERYGLSWKGKSDAFKAIRVAATGTLVPQEKESKNWNETENVFIEGDNLEALKLLQRHYRSKIKMIYIDPPYNTGKDFIYKDNFTENKSDYYERTGQSENGVTLTSNPETNGRYHSDWLTMMYPRLFLARQLLRDDGVIFISIDDNEVANLRLIMDEIFGEENFEGNIHWRRRHNQPNDPTKLLATVAEHIIVYARNSAALKEVGVGKLELTGKFSNPDNDSRGDWNSKPWKVGSNQNGSKYTINFPSGRTIDGEWMGDENTYKELLADNRIYFPKDGDGLPRKKIFKSERELDGQSATNWFENGSFGNNQEASAELAELFNGDKNLFDNPKPIKLIKNLIRLGNVRDKEIVLDFFAGSGTTAHAVMAQNAEDGGNRKWISVQIPEETSEDSEVYKVGYRTIADISRERIRRAGDKINKGDIGFKSYKLSQSNYRQWQTMDGDTTEEELKAQMKVFIDSPLVDGYEQKDVVYEIALKEGFSLNAYVFPADTTKSLILWSVIEGERKIAVVFNKHLTEEEVSHLGLTKDAGHLLVCFDSALDDSTKLNLARDFNLKVI